MTMVPGGGVFEKWMFPAAQQQQQQHSSWSTEPRDDSNWSGVATWSQQQLQLW